MKQRKPDGSCPYDNGDDWIETMGLHMSVEDCLLVLLGFYVVLRFWSFLSLWSLVRKNNH